MQEAVGDVRGLSVLDLGCGTGRHAIWLAAAGAHVTAVDFSEGMLAEARPKAAGANIRFLGHDLHEPLPFRSGAVDLVVSGLVLEHLHDLLPSRGEIRRLADAADPANAGGEALVRPGVSAGRCLVRPLTVEPEDPSGAVRGGMTRTIEIG